MKLGAIEAGGTKFVLAIADEKGKIQERRVIKTRDPKSTLEDVFEFFDNKNIEAFGLACFGPLDLDKKSKTYGYITTTPKEGWQNFDILTPLKKRYGVKVGFDTDVNGSLLGEVTFGKYRDYENILYITIGTGIGAGAMIDKKIIHGLMHPEMGHIRLVKREDDSFEGLCDYHKTCFEGLASGRALEKRWNIEASKLPSDHPAWDLEAYYIAQALATYILVLSLNVIILGGGVMHQSHLLGKIKVYLKEFLNGYIHKEELISGLDDYLVLPSLKDDSGILGALELALREVRND